MRATYRTSGGEVVGLAFHIGAARRRESTCRRSLGLERGQGPARVAISNPLQGLRRPPAQGCAGQISGCAGWSIEGGEEASRIHAAALKAPRRSEGWSLSASRSRSINRIK